MKSVLTFAFIFLSILYFGVFYNVGMAFLTGENNFLLGMRLGIESELFDFNADITYENTNRLNIMNIFDISSSVLSVDKLTDFRVGILWLNDKLTSDATQNRNKMMLYGGIKFRLTEYISLKIGMGYIISGTTSTNLLDNLIFSMTYIVPPPEDFIDQLKIEIRISQRRKDLTIYLSEPIR